MIIVPVIAKSASAAMVHIRRANRAADGIELRLDYFRKLSDADLKRMIRACKRPCICTCRTKGEGGKFTGSEATAAEILISAIKNGCHMVDMELGMKPALRKKIAGYAKKHRAVVVLSKHFTSHTPPRKELKALFNEMAKEKAHVIKIVTRATKHSDNAVMLELYKDAKKRGIKLMAFSMGEHGKDSRVLSRLLGAFAGFASLGRGFESAEGQIPVAEFRRLESEMRSLL